MIKETLGIILIFISIQVTGQDNLPPVKVQGSFTGISVKVSNFFLGGGSRHVLIPQIEYRKSNVKINLGPTFLFRSELITAEDEGPRLSGMQCTILLLPLKATNFLEFYLFDDITFQRIKDRWTSQVWNSNRNIYQGVKYINREYLLQNHVGYGMSIKPLRHIQFNIGVGAGFYYATTTNSVANDQGVQLSNNNYSSYDGFGFSWLLNCGLAYKF